MSKRMQVIDSRKVESFSQGISVKIQDKDIENKGISVEIQAVAVIDRSPFRSPTCEFCGAETKVYCVRPPFRYCKCVRCGWTFKK